MNIDLAPFHDGAFAVSNVLRGARTTHQLAIIACALKEAAIRVQEFDEATALRHLQKRCEAIPSRPVKFLNGGQA